MSKNLTENYPIVDTVEALEERLAGVREAQRIFATYTQEQVDKIFTAAALAANKARIPLAKLAVEETGMGIVEDKVIKNHYASEYIYNAYRNTKTCGVIEEDKAYGIKKVAEPIGVVAAGSHFARGVFPVEKIRQGLGDMVQIFHSLFRNFISRTPCNDTGVVAVPVAEVNHVPFMPFVKGFVVDAFFGALPYVEKFVND